MQGAANRGVFPLSPRKSGEGGPVPPGLVSRPLALAVATAYSAAKLMQSREEAVMRNWLRWRGSAGAVASLVALAAVAVALFAAPWVVP